VGDLRRSISMASNFWGWRQFYDDWQNSGESYSMQLCV
jgi:hypothetical protein